MRSVPVLVALAGLVLVVDAVRPGAKGIARASRLLPTAPWRSSVTMDSVVGAAYSLDNMVLDGPLRPLKDQVRRRWPPDPTLSPHAHVPKTGRGDSARAQVLVKLEKAKQQTEGGLFLTKTGSDTPFQGVTVSVGPGKPHPYSDVIITNPVEAGDVILFGEYAGTKVKYCLDEHVLLSADEVLAKITSDGTVVPVRDRLMLKPIEKPVETSAGIVLTQEAAKAQEVPNQGEVIAVGEGRFTSSGTIEPLAVAVGDKVMYTKYGGTTIEYKGEKYIFVFAADCLAAWSSSD